MVEQTIEGNLTINSLEEKMSNAGVKFWKFNSKNGISGTIWDDKIAKDVQMNIGVPCEATIKTTQNGKYFNLRMFKPVNSTIEVENIPASGGDMQIPVERVESAPEIMYSNKDKSIIAQTLCKCRFYGDDKATNEDVIEAYKQFIEKLNHINTPL